MTGRIIDIAERSRDKRAVHQPEPNGHRSSKHSPSIPQLNVDVLTLVSQRQRISDLPATAEGRLYIVVNPDNSWEVKVARADERHSLILRGTEAASTPTTLREIVCWLFGVPA